ncbi:MAG: AMP-binding protein [Vicinamibacterales bacterium]
MTAPFTTLLGTVRATLLDAYAHQRVPFEHLLTRLPLAREANTSSARAGALQSPLRAGRRHHLRRAHWTPVDIAHTAAQFELSVHVDPGLTNQLYFEYNTDLFSAATIDRFADHYLTLLAGLARLARTVPLPTCRCSARSNTPAIEELGRHTLAHVPEETLETTVPALVDAQIARVPDRVAVVCGDQRRSACAELGQQADALAARLRARGVGADVLVGVSVDRSIDMVVAVLGVLKAGGAYVPADPGRIPPSGSRS